MIPVATFLLTTGNVPAAMIIMRIITVSINAPTTEIRLTSVIFVRGVTNRCGFVAGVTKDRVHIAITNVQSTHLLKCVRSVETFLEMTGIWSTAHWMIEDIIVSITVPVTEKMLISVTSVKHIMLKPCGSVTDVTKGKITIAITNVLSIHLTSCVRSVTVFLQTTGSVRFAQQMRLITVSINAPTTKKMLTSVTSVTKVTNRCGLVRDVKEDRIVIVVTNVLFILLMICVKSVKNYQQTI